MFHNDSQLTSPSGQISGGNNEGPIGSSGKRRGLGFQDQQ